MRELLLLMMLVPSANDPTDRGGELVAALERDDAAAVARCCGGPLEEAYRAYADLRRALERLEEAGFAAPLDVEKVEIHRHAGLDVLRGGKVEFRHTGFTAGTADQHFVRQGPAGEIEGTIDLAKYPEGWKVVLVHTGDAAAARRGLEKLVRLGDHLRMNAEVAEALAEEMTRGAGSRDRFPARWEALLAVATRDYRVLEAYRDDPKATRLRPKDVTDGGLRFLPRFRKLEDLSLKGCERVTDRGLVHLEGLSGLRALDLEDCTAITDTGLLHVGELGGLTELGLEGCSKITDTGLARLAGLENLEKLDLAKCSGITDAGLASLARLRRLERLYLNLCPQLTDAAVEHLSKLGALRTLNLFGCTGLSDAAVGELREALPGCEIRR